MTTNPKQVLKSVGPKLVPFFKTFALFFVLYPHESQASVIYCIFKCLPVISLILFVLSHGIRLTEEYSYSRRVLFGLIFSCLGDAFLVWQKQGYFLHGLACFSVAQFAYTTAFGFRPFNVPVASVVCVYGAMFYSYIFPFMKGLAPFGALYCVLICGMLWRAISRLQFFDDLWTWTKLCSCLGAISFIISDSLLAYDHFAFKLPYGQQLIMFFYYFAQFGIALSVVDSHVDGVMEISSR